MSAKKWLLITFVLCYSDGAFGYLQKQTNFLKQRFPTPSIIRASSEPVLAEKIEVPDESNVVHCDSTGRFCWKGNSDADINRMSEDLYEDIKRRDPHQVEFLQAFKEVLNTLTPVIKNNPKYLEILRTIAEPERMVAFRVPWLTDEGEQKINRGYRVQFNSALGPYKGGLRFHPSVNLSIMKFLGFEQIFKNALTGLPMGGGKGGSDFDPKGKSEAEVLRFCQSFMTELARHIGHNEDVPAGDIGVGGREIGYLYGQYKRLTSQFEGALTGKNVKWGGSNMRTEATGYGAVYFANELAKDAGMTIEGSRALISGCGNVAQYCAAKLIEMGAKVLTMSDSSGFIYAENGLTKEDLNTIMYLKNEKKARLAELSEYTDRVRYFPGEKPWRIPCDIAFPCSTQNDIGASEAKQLVANKCKMVVEGANMPSTLDAIKIYKDNNIILGPAKAANCGGVAVSGLEMSQNSMRTYWTAEDVDSKLKAIMKSVHNQCKSFATDYSDPSDLLAGANIAGFLKVADSVSEQGCV